MEILKEIKITEIGNFQIGNSEDKEGGTGVTVIISKEGMRAGVDIRGGGPASRETPLLSPYSNPDILNALVFSGGSAFGLNASTGVVKYLEEKNIGYETDFQKIPLVCHSCIYDLGYKSKKKPDEKMGYDACINSEKNIPLEGNVGVGCGATVGKFYGMDQCQKAGIGIYAVEIQGLKVGALVVVNAWGDVFNGKGEKIAGLTTKDKKQFLNFKKEMYKSIKPPSDNKALGNTTLAAIITNAKFSKAHLCKIASMAQDAFARRIDPIHTMYDGDTIYALTTDEIEADINIVGTIATKVLETAIERSVMLAKEGDDVK